MTIPSSTFCICPIRKPPAGHNWLHPADASVKSKMAIQPPDRIIGSPIGSVPPRKLIQRRAKVLGKRTGQGHHASIEMRECNLFCMQCEPLDQRAFFPVLLGTIVALDRAKENF